MSVPLWEECAWGTFAVKEEEATELSSDFEPKLLINESINRRIYLYCGEIYKIPSDAIIVGQNEVLSYRADGIDNLIVLAGPAFEHEMNAVIPVETGTCVDIKGGSLPCDTCIFAVGPKYDKNYITAAEYALFNCYKSSLLLAAEKGAKRLIISCVYLR